MELAFSTLQIQQKSSAFYRFRSLHIAKQPPLIRGVYDRASNPDKLCI
jgi:hypothetical protein